MTMADEAERASIASPWQSARSRDARVAASQSRSLTAALQNRQQSRQLRAELPPVPLG